MLPRDKWHKSVTDKKIMAAVKRRQRTLDNPGFCLECGNEQEGCESDARRYKCESCGKKEVYGSDELLMYIT